VLVTVVLEQRFVRDRGGRVWTPGAFSYRFWQRYLDVFDSVNIVARVEDSDSAPPGWREATGAAVHCSAVPMYIGPWQYIARARQVHRAIATAIGARSAVILRIPGTLSACAVEVVRRRRQPFGVEVVGDSYDVFRDASTRSLTRFFLRWWAPRQQRQQCRGAVACSYVTASSLQRRYPAGPGALSVSCSDVELDGIGLLTAPRQYSASPRRKTVLSIGTFEQLYKAPDVLIDAVADCVDGGCDLQLRFVGEGRFRKCLEERPAARRLGDRLVFCGAIPERDAVRREIDTADLFVLPSRTDSMPRALIEAMARGLPCIGSTVGGIPELLAQEDLVRPESCQLLASMIQAVVRSPERMNAMSARNLRRAAEFDECRLSEVRQRFFRHVRDCTDVWLRRGV